MNQEQMIRAIEHALKKMQAEDCDHHRYKQLLGGLLVDLVLAFDPEEALSELTRLRGMIPGRKDNESR